MHLLDFLFEFMEADTTFYEMLAIGSIFLLFYFGHPSSCGWFLLQCRPVMEIMLHCIFPALMEVKVERASDNYNTIMGVDEYGLHTSVLQNLPQ